MNKIFVKILLVTIIACTLAACGTVPTSTATGIPPTVEQTTLTPMPLPTQQPSQTLTAEPTRSASQTPPSTTIDSTEAAFSDCINPGANLNNRSPQETWAICGFDGGDFTVVNRDGTSWDFSMKEQFGVEYHGYMGLTHWTTDENFLYFSILREIGDPILRLNLNTEVLLRMDLSSRKTSILLGDLAPSDIHQSRVERHIYVASISPTTRRLAYSRNKWASPDTIAQLHLVDLQNSDEKVIDMEPEYDVIGNFSWSDNGQQFVYKLYDETETDFCPYTYSIRFLDLRDFSSNTFIQKISLNHCEGNVDEFNVVEVSADQVVLEKNYEIWIYNVKSQRLTSQGTATPYPK